MVLPLQRWQITSPQPELADRISSNTGLSPLLAQVLINRGMNTPERSQIFLDPDREPLLDPKLEFPDLSLSLDILENAIKNQQKVAICGDYDADGMTSTALLLRTLRLLGVDVSYEIPSRMHEGYGINVRMVEDLQARGVSLIITVDNGISAFAAIARARELNLAVIITDHHDLPEQLPPANAILNPKLINSSSPYYAIAGVGVAYVLALELADRFGKRQELESLLLELFTLGTIADLAHLTGINRRLVKQGLRLLGRSQLAGVTALIQASGIADDQKIGLKPEAIGFSLGPRINAVGRIGDPVTVIELLTADDMGIAITLAQKCEETNRTRQELCSQIEREAIAYIQSLNLDLIQERVLVVVQPNWHHGVIGIVASRLVERYGVPVFIGTYEEEDPENISIRGSVRSIPEFNVFEALEYCREFLNKYGGHPAAGGFSMASENLSEFCDRLREFAHIHLQPHHLKPLITVDVKADLQDISLTLLEQIDLIHPCGMGNSDPVFYTPNVRVISQQVRGKNKACLALELDRGNGSKIKAIAWRWGEYCPIPDRVDLAYKLRANKWQDKTSVELELVGIRTVWNPILESKPAPKINPSFNWQKLESLENIPQPALIYGHDRPEVRPELGFDCDRPIPQKNYQSLILWSLPPSITHLRWLIALTKPAQIYLGDQIPTLWTSSALKQKLSLYIDQNINQNSGDLLTINLLDLGQRLWLAPSVIVSALRELGYDSPDFPLTKTLDIELENLNRWYQLPVDRLMKVLQA